MGSTFSVALATWVMVLITLWIAFLQSKRDMLTNTAKTLMSLRNQYDSADMRIDRKKTAGILAINGNLPERDDSVLVFFETIGMLAKARVLDKELVWNEFSWEIIRWYSVLAQGKEDFIKKFRENSKDSTLYEGFEWVYEMMLKMDAKRRKMDKAVVVLNEGERVKFLTDEQSLRG
jgi:hypothetical protein